MNSDGTTRLAAGGYANMFLDTPLRVWSLGALMLICEALLCVVIIVKVAYTEIDWVAYMQEVQGFLAGERDYANIKGDTGPCVYPAGFLYIFSGLYYATDQGLDIRAAQFIFAALYLINLGLIVALYASSKRPTRVPLSQQWSLHSPHITIRQLLTALPSQLASVPGEALGSVPFWAYGALVMSKRVHSLFVLRMFNDPVAALLGYAAVLLFTRDHWRLGCAVYSAAVSVKMNMLLYAPGLLLLLILQSRYSLRETALCLCICAAVQVILGAPFLLTHPTSYLLRAFDLRRSFFYKWTVNLKFLPEEIFLSPELSVGLLLATVATLGLFAYKWVEAVRQQERRLVQVQTQQRSLEQKQYNGIAKQPQQQKQQQKQQQQQNRSRSRSRNRPGQSVPSSPHGGFSSLPSVAPPLPLSNNTRLSAHFILTTLFTSNLIGIAFARTLHYQFYAWYFHQLPFLLYHAAVPGWAALASLAVVEGCYLTFPATAISSGALCFVHALLLVSLYVAPVPLAFVGLETVKERERE